MRNVYKIKNLSGENHFTAYIIVICMRGLEPDRVNFDC
jgi:hypothetical protein